MCQLILKDKQFRSSQKNIWPKILSVITQAQADSYFAFLCCIPCQGCEARKPLNENLRERIPTSTQPLEALQSTPSLQCLPNLENFKTVKEGLGSKSDQSSDRHVQNKTFLMKNDLVHLPHYKNTIEIFNLFL